MSYLHEFISIFLIDQMSITGHDVCNETLTDLFLGFHLILVHGQRGRDFSQFIQCALIVPVQGRPVFLAGVQLVPEMLLVALVLEVKPK